MMADEGSITSPGVVLPELTGVVVACGSRCCSRWFSNEEGDGAAKQGCTAPGSHGEKENRSGG
jgi:hypothetical protein